MRTRVSLFLTSVAFTSMVVTATAQDPLALKECGGLNECTEQDTPVLAAVAPQDQPEVKKRVNPYYPEVAQRAGLEGEVFLKVTIDEKGKVDKVEAIKFSDPVFVDAASKAAEQWEFTPAMKEGKPIRAEVTIPFKFKLAEKVNYNKRDEIMHLQEDVHRLLRGESTKNVKTQIGTSAYAVVGNKDEYLASLFSEKSKWSLLIEGPESKIETSRLALDDSGDMAYLVLKTKPSARRAERFHTVIFSKSKDGAWTIAAWHAGE